MRLLADEGCDTAIITALRGLGHDVLAICETRRGATDDDVLAMAVADDRALLTEDKDFGQLVFAALARSPGVILLRFGLGDRAALLDALADLLTLHEERIRSSFIVVSPGRIRLSPSPPAE